MDFHTQTIKVGFTLRYSPLQGSWGAPPRVTAHSTMAQSTSIARLKDIPTQSYLHPRWTRPLVTLASEHSWTYLHSTYCTLNYCLRVVCDGTPRGTYIQRRRSSYLPFSNLSISRCFTPKGAPPTTLLPLCCGVFLLCICEETGVAGSTSPYVPSLWRMR